MRSRGPASARSQLRVLRRGKPGQRGVDVQDRRQPGQMLGHLLVGDLDAVVGVGRAQHNQAIPGARISPDHA